MSVCLVVLKTCFKTESEKRINAKHRHQALGENVLAATENRKKWESDVFLFPVHVLSQLKLRYCAIQRALFYKKTGKAFVGFQF